MNLKESVKLLFFLTVIVPLQFFFALFLSDEPRDL